MNTSTHAGFGQSFSTDVHTILQILREKAWFIAFCVLAALALGAAYLFLSPKIYRARTVLQVEQEEKSLLSLEGLKAEDLRAQEVLTTIEQNITDPGLLLRIVRENNLMADPAFLPGLKRPASEDKVQKLFAKQISAKLRTGTRLIDVSVDDRSPSMARKLSQLLIAEFIRQGFEGRFESSQMAHDFMVQEAGRLREKLASSEEALQAYREQTQTVSLEDKQNIVVEKLRELNLRVTEAKAARLKLESDKTQLAQVSGKSPAKLLAISSVASSGPVFELQKAIREKEAAIATLKQRYKPRHPKYIAALSELQELKAGLDDAALKGVDSVAQAYEAAVATERGLEAALKEQEKLAIELNKKGITFSALNSEVISDRSLYDSVVKRLKESDLTKDIARNAVRVVSGPIASEVPVKPSKKRALALSLVGGLSLGCGLSLLSRALDTSVRSVDDAEHHLGLPALAAIPHTRSMKSLQDGLHLLNNAGSHAAESFRTLRTSLALLGRGSGGTSILFTSAIPNEGKSFCAINTAIAFSQQGLKTLLIDADLRLPSVGGVFFGEKTFPGLTDILMKRATFEGATRPSGVENLSILCAGTRMPKVAELLTGGGFAELIREASLKFDRVVVDSAPIHAVSDTLLLVEHVEAACMVVQAERTPLAAVLSAIRKLKKAGVAPLGFVLNGVSQLRHEDYPSYYRVAYDIQPSPELGDRPGMGDRNRPRPELQDRDLTKRA